MDGSEWQSRDLELSDKYHRALAKSFDNAVVPAILLYITKRLGKPPKWFGKTKGTGRKIKPKGYKERPDHGDIPLMTSPGHRENFKKAATYSFPTPSTPLKESRLLNKWVTKGSGTFGRTIPTSSSWGYQLLHPTSSIKWRGSPRSRRYWSLSLQNNGKKLCAN